MKNEKLAASSSVDTIAEGNYKIRAANTTNKYLDVDSGSNGEIVRINRIGSEVADNIWKVEKVSGFLGGYTIRSKKFPNKYLDADFLKTHENGCKVQLWNRTGPQGEYMSLNGSLISTNQEWFIEKVEGRSKTYRIKNIKSPTMFLDAKDDGSADSRVKLYERIGNDESQMWVFEKA